MNRGLIVSLCLATAVLLFYELGDCRTLGKHEAFAVVPAQNMLRTGDWLVPRFGGLPRLEKPPGAYWVLAVTGKWLGGLDEFRSRVPAAFSTLALGALIGVWGGRWYGRVSGVGAAVAFVSSIFSVTYSRRAEIDMLLCLVTTAALALIATQPETESGTRRFVRSTAFWALLATSWMLKFHYGPAMVLTPVAVFLVLHRRWTALKALLNPIGLAAMALAVWWWSAEVVRRLPEAIEIWATQTLGRVSGELGAEPWWFYLEHLIIQTMPWTPLALLTAVGSWNSAWRGSTDIEHNEGDSHNERRKAFRLWAEFAGKGDRRERFLWIWFLTQLAILMASAGKHSHYLAAALPMVSLLAGRGIALVVERLQAGRFEWDRTLAVGSALLIAAAAGIVGFALSRRWPDLTAVAWALAAVMTAGGGVTTWLAYRRHYVAACHALIAGFVLSDMLAAGHLMLAEDFRRHAARYAAELRAESGPQSPMFTYQLGADPMLYYLGEPAQRLESPEMVRQALSERDELRIVTTEPWLPDLPQFGQVRVISRIPQSAVDSDRRVPRLVVASVTREPEPPPSPARGEIRHAGRY